MLKRMLIIFDNRNLMNEVDFSLTMW